MSGQTASNPIVACGVGGTIYTRIAQKKENENSSPSCCNCKLKDGEYHIPLHIVAAATRRKCSEGSLKKCIKNQQDGYSPPVTSFRDNPSWLRSAASLSSHLSCSRPCKVSQHRWTGRTPSLPCSSMHKNQVSLSRLSVNSSSLDMFKVATIVGFSYEHNFQIFPASQMTN
jgi:hypothetical protein